MSSKSRLTNLKISQLLILSTPFISGIHLQLGGANLYLHYVVLIAAWTWLISITKKLYILKNIYICFFGITLISLVNILLSSMPEIKTDIIEYIAECLAKIIFALIFAQALLSLYHSYGKSIEALFKDYLKVSLLFCYIAIAEQLIFVLLKIDITAGLGLSTKFYGFYLGAPGLSVEPAFFACSILPACCYYLLKTIETGKISYRTCITISALLCSTSSLGILGLMVCVLFGIALKSKNLLRTILFISPILFTVGYSVITSDFFQLRLNDSIELLDSKTLTLKDGMNLSTYAIGVNTAITTKSISDNSGLGVGFGQYSAAFDHYIGQHEMPTHRDNIPGRGSATSFILRISAELGAIGLILFLVIILKLSHPLGKSELNNINIACLTTIIIISLRMGEYYVNGVIFIFAIFYITHKEINRLKSRSKSSPNRIISAP